MGDAETPRCLKCCESQTGRLYSLLPKAQRPSRKGEQDGGAGGWEEYYEVLPSGNGMAVAMDLQQLCSFAQEQESYSFQHEWGKEF